MALPKTIDAVVIGAGPAGLGAALALRDRGLSVLAADGAGLAAPIDKACGEGLMPDAVAALERLGVDVFSVEHESFKGIRFIGSGSSAEAAFSHGVGAGLRRTVLHGLMAGAAQEAGVRFAWATPATAIGEGFVAFGAERVRTKWIIGADGGYSATRRWAGLQSGMKSKERYGFRKHFRVAPWSEFVEVYWGEGCQIYVTPVSRYEVGVAVVSKDRRLRVDQAVARFDGLARQLRGAAEASTERGAISAMRRLRRVGAAHVALVGDASGSVDAVTGEGLSLAFQQAPALAAAIASGDLSRYEAEHARIRKAPMLMAEVLLLLDGWSGLRNRVLPALAARPRLFEGMLAGHVGAANPVMIAANLAALGWAMLF